jgi:hypothetical protein
MVMREADLFSNGTWRKLVGKLEPVSITGV